MLAYPPVRLGATEVLIVDVDRCEDTLAGPYGTSAATWPGQLRVDLAQLAATAVVSDALKGEVCLIRGYGGKLDLQSLRRLVVAHGGEAHGSQSELVTLIIDADEVSGESVRARVEQAMQQEVRSYDIVRASWLLDIHLAEKRLPLEPRYLLYAKPETREQMATTMDRWGDRFTEEATVESLTQAAALVRKQTLDERRDVAQLTDWLRLYMSRSAYDSTSRSGRGPPECR